MNQCEPFLTSDVSNLILENYIINSDASGGELNPNSGLGIKEAKLVHGKPREKIGFSHTKVTDQHHLEQVIVIIIYSICSH